MRTTILLSTTTAVVLIASGIAFAQGMKNDEHPGRAPAAQQNAPAEKMAPPLTQSTHKAPETTGQGILSPDTKRSEQNAAPHAGQASPAEEHGQGTLHMNRDGNASENKSPADKNESRSATGQGSDKTETRGTTGQGAAGAAMLSTEQRTRISTILRQHKVASEHLNVTVAVGTRVPASVHLYPLPMEVIDINPEWRGFDYIMVGDEILVIDPVSRDIVAIIGA
jgi:hypothetical protein